MLKKPFNTISIIINFDIIFHFLQPLTEIRSHFKLLNLLPLFLVPDFTDQSDTLVRKAAANGVTNDNTTPGVRAVLAILVPVIWVSEIGVVFVHESNHTVVA
ncbi:hypothetical protein ACJW30_10G011100 [Castanea mollissima]